MQCAVRQGQRHLGIVLGQRDGSFRRGEGYLGSRIDCAEPLRWFHVLGRSFQCTEKQFCNISVEDYDLKLLEALEFVFLPGVLGGRAGGIGGQLEQGRF